MHFALSRTNFANAVVQRNQEAIRDKMSIILVPIRLYYWGNSVDIVSLSTYKLPGSSTYLRTCIYTGPQSIQQQRIDRNAL